MTLYQAMGKALSDILIVLALGLLATALAIAWLIAFAMYPLTLGITTPIVIFVLATLTRYLEGNFE